MRSTECMLSPGTKRECFGRTCDDCGWNPDVTKARIYRIRRECRPDIKNPYRLKVRKKK